MLHAAFCLKHRSLFLPTIYQVIDRPHQQKCANLRVTVKMNITNVPNRTADSLPTLLLLQLFTKDKVKVTRVVDRNTDEPSACPC